MDRRIVLAKGKLVCMHGQFSKKTDEILLNKQEPGETGSTRFETGSDAVVLNAHDIFHLETAEASGLKERMFESPLVADATGFKTPNML